MKKRIRDLTEEELGRICTRAERCISCPLSRGWYCVAWQRDNLPPEVEKELDTKIIVNKYKKP